MSATRATFVLVLALAWAISDTTAFAAAATDVPTPTVIKAEPAPDWNAKFDAKEGWIGGDGVYSTALDKKRVLFLFGDTILGNVKDGRRVGAVMVNNTVAVLSGHDKHAGISFVSGKKDGGKPAAIFTPEDGKGWFWPLAALRIRDRLFVFLAQIERAREPGPFGFKHVAQWLVVVENPDDDPQNWRVTKRHVPFAEFGPERERSWGSAVMADADYLYVYGYEEERGKGLGRRKLTIARVPAEKLSEFDRWQFRTTTGWSDRPADAVTHADGLATEFSVSRMPGGKGFILVYTENGLGDRIVARYAVSPAGPWSAPALLYRCPEMAGDKGVFCYAAKAHPWAAAGNELLISYCVNSWKFGRLFEDDKVYRPKFVRVQLGRRVGTDGK